MHTGRKLEWMHNLARAEVRLTYLDRRYEVILGVNQVNVLLLFSNLFSLTRLELQARSGIDIVELDKIMKSFSDSKLLIIDESNNSFNLNLHFTSKRIKVKIASVQIGAAKTDDSLIVKTINEDRNICLQANIVRIMKCNKEMDHLKLTQAVIEQCRNSFHPDISMIKKCIEQLIEKQFIARHLNDKDVYVYVS